MHPILSPRWGQDGRETEAWRANTSRSSHTAAGEHPPIDTRGSLGPGPPFTRFQLSLLSPELVLLGEELGTLTPGSPHLWREGVTGKVRVHPPYIMTILTWLRLTHPEMAKDEGGAGAQVWAGAPGVGGK